MVATRRTVLPAASSPRPRRVVTRSSATARVKRSRSASTASLTREAAGLPPTTRSQRALLTTAASSTANR
ncbi:hypothetical protein Emed_007623 [Eimeria media]